MEIEYRIDSSQLIKYPRLAHTLIHSVKIVSLRRGASEPSSVSDVEAIGLQPGDV